MGLTILRGDMLVTGLTYRPPSSPLPLLPHTRQHSQMWTTLQASLVPSTLLRQVNPLTDNFHHG